MSGPQPETNAAALARDLAGVRAKLQAEQQAHEQTRREVAELLGVSEPTAWNIAHPRRGQ